MGNKSSKKHYKVPPNAVIKLTLVRPDPPGKPVAETQHNGVYLQWMSPKSDGKCPIIGYIVQHLEIDDGIWHSSNPIPGKECLIHNLENEATYQFRVIAENLIGYSSPSLSSEPVLFSTSSAHPRFITKIQNISAIENEKVDFYVQVTGRPTPKLKWYLNEDEIISNGNFIVDNQQLTIRRAMSELQGEIKCSASNEIGIEYSIAALTVGAPPRILEDSTREIIFRVDELLRIKFTFSGRPKPEVSWFHNGIPLDAQDNFIEILANSSSLKVSHATRAHRGEYSVKVENNLGVDTGSVLVTVADRPLPTSTPTVVLLRDNSCMLEWKDGSDDGGCPVQCYIVEYFRTGWDVWLTGATSKSKFAKIRDLIPGSKYKFRIKAENLYGLSEPSEASVELFIPEMSSGLMTPLTEAEEEYDESLTSENLRLKEDSRIQVSNSPKPIIRTNMSSIKDTPTNAQIQIEQIEHDFSQKPPQRSSVPNFSTRETGSLIFDHYTTAASANRRSPSPLHFRTPERKMSEMLSLSSSSGRLDRGSSKPWNQSQQLDEKSLLDESPPLQVKSLSFPREINIKSLVSNDRMNDGSPPRSYSSASSHLIYEGSSSSDDEDTSIVTCSSLTVLKSGNCQIKTCSREELTRSFDNISKMTSPSKNSLNSEDFEYYNSIFGKTCYNTEDEEEHVVKESPPSDQLQSSTIESSNHDNEEHHQSSLSDVEEIENNWRWWYLLIIPIFLCLFFKYILVSNICIMLYVFYRLVMIFFE